MQETDWEAIYTGLAKKLLPPGASLDGVVGAIIIATAISKSLGFVAKAIGHHTSRVEALRWQDKPKG